MERVIYATTPSRYSILHPEDVMNMTKVSKFLHWSREILASLFVSTASILLDGDNNDDEDVDEDVDEDDEDDDGKFNDTQACAASHCCWLHICNISYSLGIILYIMQECTFQ